VTGKWGLRNRHKVFVDDESYNSGFGKAYEFYGVDPKRGALVVVRPDQCECAFSCINDNADNSKMFLLFLMLKTMLQYLSSSKVLLYLNDRLRIHPLLLSI
jgi:hypothetical protein